MTTEQQEIAKVGSEYSYDTAMAAEWFHLGQLPLVEVKVGDTVVAAVGFIGCGHFWVRETVVVEEVYVTSAKFRVRSSLRNHEPLHITGDRRIILEVIRS